MTTVHVVGAGMAGMAAALALSRHGVTVALHEATGHAGGRCRSFHDEGLDREIDNGNHLLLSGNTAAAAYLAETGAGDSFVTADGACFPFVDLSTGERWSIRPNAGRLPWWIFVSGRRVPGSHAWHYLAALRLSSAGPDATVAQLLGDDANLFRRFWEPLAIAVLNTPAEHACARLLWPVLVETFGRGAAACRPKLARRGLSASLVEPALATLDARGVAVQFGHRLRRLHTDADRIIGLEFTDTAIEVDRGDQVVLAVPAPVAPTLLAGLSAPRRFHAIVNVHFRLDRPPTASGALPFLGIIGGTAEWAFVRGDVVSVTVSAADALVEAPADDIARDSWDDVCRALALGPVPLPPFRVVKERRATFAQTPCAERSRPHSTTELRNLYLAGDWTNTGLPATIEGAIRSGFTAASAALKAGNP